MIGRRTFLKTTGAFAVSATSGGAFANDAQETSENLGRWAALSDMPFPVQEIYPAPFWKAPSTEPVIKPRPFNIVVNAGGLTAQGEFNVSDNVTYYDPSTDRWQFGAPLPEARHHIALVNHHGYLYGIGGFSRDQRGRWRMRRNCWRTGDLDNDWSIMAPMQTPQSEAVCVSLGGYIHVIGGRSPASSRNREWSDHIDTNSHWIYDAASNRWETAPPMPTARNSAAGAIVNNALYVIGGRTVSEGNLAVVEVYDSLSNRWEKARPMPKAQGGLAAAVIRSKIYVFGGEYFSASGGGVFADTWEYNPATDAWRAMEPMPRKRHGLGAVTIDNVIYVIGGASSAGGVGTSAAVDKFEM